MVWHIITKTLAKFVDDNGPFLAAGLAFNLILYCMPLALLAVSALGYTLESSEAALAWVQDSLRQFVPRSQTEIFGALSQIIENRGLFGLSGFLLYIILSSALFAAARIVLNQVFQVTQPRHFLRGILVDIGMLVAMATIVILNVGIGVLMAMAEAIGEQIPYVERVATLLWRWGTYGMGVLMTALLFYVFYRFLPATTISSGALVVASVTATVLLELSKWGFAIYVSLSQSNVALYGALGGLIFFFLWLYYGSVVFVLGAEAGWQVDRYRDQRG